MVRAYLRVSTAEQAADGTTSIAEQKRRCKAIATLRDQPFETYIDAGVSGSTPLVERPAGDRIMLDAQKGDAICASKMDRLFRSAQDALNTAAELKAKGVDLILIDIGVEPVTRDGPGKLFFTMMAAIAEFERERIAERMRDGKLGKQDRNGHNGGDAPFGYYVVGTGRSATLVDDEAEQKVLARLRELRCHTHIRYRPHRLCVALNKEGLLTRSGRPWQVVQMQRLLRRETQFDG